MARPRKHDGVVYRRSGTQLWWMRYRDRDGQRRHEPTGTADWKEANQKLRERLQARDENLLDIVRKGEQMAFAEWAEAFLENYSKPPLRTPKTHEANVRGREAPDRDVRMLKLADLSAEAIEGTYADDCDSGRRKTQGWVRRKGLASTNDGPPGVPGAATDTQRGGPEKAAARESVFRRGVPRQSEEPLPAALHVLVGAATDRSASAE